MLKVLSHYPFIEVVAEAGNGKETLGKVRAFSPDLITVAINLPGMNGFDLAEILMSKLMFDRPITMKPGDKKPIGIGRLKKMRKIRKILSAPASLLAGALFSLALLLILPGISWAAYITQQGKTEVTLAAQTAPITAVSSTDRAFILFYRGTGYTNGNQNADEVMINGYLSATDEITIQRQNGANSTWVGWQVVECTDQEFEVFRGSGSFNTTQTETSAAIGATVTPADCFAWVVGDSDSASRNFYNEAELTAYVDSATTVKIQRADSGNVTSNYRWVVVEFDPAKISSIEHGSTTVTNETEGSPRQVTINSVDLNASILLFQHRTDTNGIPHAAIAGRFAGQTGIEFYQHIAAPTGTEWIEYYVIDFGSNAQAQRGRIDNSADPGWYTETVSVSSVREIGSTLHFQSMTCNGVNTGAAYPRPYALTYLFANDTLLIERKRQGQATWNEWQILELPYPTSTPTPSPSPTLTVTPTFPPTLIPTPSPSPTPVDLPPPWLHQDVGSVGIVGDASYSGGVFTIDGDGADIWGTADAFHFVYQSLAGDGEIYARVVSIENTDTWAKAGVMIREELTADSTHATSAVTTGNGIAFQRRTTTGGSSEHTAGGGYSAPYWVRMVRSGDTFTSYESDNGTSWTEIGSASISMSTNVYIGLAVTSHDGSQLCTAEFDNVTVITPPPTPTPSPSVTPTPIGFKTPTPTPIPTATPGPEVIYFFPLNTDPAWSRDSDWAYGQPENQGGEHGNPDPDQGHTGDNVYGYNLAGDYPNDLYPTRWLTTSEIDCSQITATTLSFYRWLNVERSQYDHAYLEASSDGLIWLQLWENPDSTITDSSWVQFTYDISGVADRQSSVYLRWGMGTTDSSWRYSGWNIDDIAIIGLWHTTPTPSVTPTPTPSVTPTPIGFNTPTPSPSVTPTPDSYKTPTPSPSVTPTPPPAVIYSFPLDTDPGWTTESSWAFGQPQGLGGEHGNPDPDQGYTGDNVYGYNLAGDYPNDLSPIRWLTTSEIDCTQITDTVLSFERWLNVESSLYDHAYLEVSYNGSDWISLWSNPSSDITDSGWAKYTYDVSAVADGRSLYIRWGMGTTDGSYRFSGWNIDDIEIRGLWHTTPTPSVTPTPSPSITSTPTPTATPTATPSTTPTPVGYKTPTPTPTPLTSPTATPKRVIIGKGYATYYVMGEENNMMNAYQAIPNSLVDPAWTGANINSRVSIVATGDDVNIFLDEWENGYNYDRSDPYNTADAKWCVADGTELNAGDVLNLTNDFTAVTGSYGVDSGDVLHVMNAPLNIVRTIWPDYLPGTYMAGSWELYPIQHWENTYTVPVGADTRPPDLPFEYSYLFVQAFSDNTRVRINDPYYAAAWEVDTVIGNGEEIIYPDPDGADFALYSVVHQGTYVIGTFDGTTDEAPLQAGIVTSQNGNVDSRFYTLTPNDLLGHTYFIPTPSFTAVTEDFSGRAMENTAYIFSFQTDTNIYIETSSGTEGPINLGDGDVYYYVLPSIPRGTWEGEYATKIFSDQTWKKIWILISGDDNNSGVDFGYQALFPEYFGKSYYLPYAPSNPTHLTPLYDDTTFYVDWDNDWRADTSFVLDQLENRLLFPPSWTSPTGYDGTGAHIWADKKFPLAWAQDNTQHTLGPEADGYPPDYDYGFTILPLHWFDPFMGLSKEANPTELPPEGGTVYFTIEVESFYYTVYNLDIYDYLPPSFDYQTGTTTITYTDGTPESHSDPTWDGSTDPQTLTWALDYDMSPYNLITLEFGAAPDSSALPGQYMNRGQAYGTDLPVESSLNCAYFWPEDWAFVSLKPEVVCPCPLYLHPDGPDPGSERDLDRVAPTGDSPTTETISNGSTLAFFGSQSMVYDLVIDGTSASVAYLYFQNSSGTPDITVTFAYSHVADFSTYTVLGSDLISDITTSGWQEFILAMDATIDAGNYLGLGVTESASGSDSIDLVYDSVTYYSRVALNTTTFTSIEWLRTYDDAYPGGVETDVFEAGDTIYYRCKVTNPFGNSDITDCRITIYGTQGSPVVNDLSMEPPVGYGSKIYEYPFTTDWQAGDYDTTVVAYEGTEGSCTSTAANSITTGDPTAVKLKSLTAEGYRNLVAIEWETGVEIDTLGFYLLRSLSPEGPFLRVSDDLIFARGSGAIGARYLFLDYLLTNGTVYYYQLEEVETTGASNYYGPVKAAPSEVSGSFTYNLGDYAVVVDNGTSPSPTPTPSSMLHTPSPTPLPTPHSPLPIIDYGDYSGDGTSDIAIFRPEDGLWSIRGVTRTYFGTSGDVPASGDYDGDFTADIALFRPSSGLWAIRLVSRIYYGGDGDIPAPADYDGDGLTDIAVFRPETGLWAVRDVTRSYLGQSGDRPLPGDYDGDGTADIAVFRPETRLWAVRGLSRFYFGGSSDQPVPADYDGDWADDIAVFRPAPSDGGPTSGLWAIRGLTRIYFGKSGDRPVPGVYGGDGASNIAVFRPASGLWAIRNITRSYYGRQNDLPITR